jgi:tetratricopeptide (TPR) repeat protein
VAQSPEIPPYLLEASPNYDGNPPVDPLVESLPFAALPWESFERLIYRLAEAQGQVEHASEFGVRGQAQHGIDVYARLKDGTFVTYQCKQRKKLAASNFKAAVDKFLKGPWAAKSDRFVFCTSQSTKRTEIVEAFEEQYERLQGLPKPITFELWGEEKLATMLRSQSSYVLEFFGPVWNTRFSPEAAGRRGVGSSEEQVQWLVDHLEVRTVLVTLNWARPQLRETVDEYEADRPRRFSQLVGDLGREFDVARTRRFIETPPAWMDDADDKDWGFVAELAEARGLWDSALRASMNAGGLAHEDYAKAGYLADAAVAAGVAGDSERRDALLVSARELFSQHPKVLVVGIDDKLTAEEQLNVLGAADARKKKDEVLLEGQRALACMQVPDFDRAQVYLAKVEKLAPGSLTARSLGVCLEVQIGRMSVMNGTAIDTVSLTRAAEEGERLRAEFVNEQRFGEAARTLMLVADAYGLLWQREKAERLLLSASDQELAAEDSAEVLGSSALRMMHFRTALILTKDAAESDWVSLIRATAQREIGTPDEKAAALIELDRLVHADGHVGNQAALMRLATSLDSDAPWSEEAERVLLAQGFERQMLTAKAYYANDRGRHFNKVSEVLGDHAETSWGRIVLFRCSLYQQKHTVIRNAAKDVLAVAPPQQVRVDAGQALARCGDFDNAQTHLIQAARDPGTPAAARADAYFLLLHIAGRERDDWKLVRVLFDEWVKLTPGDSRASAWAPTVYAKSTVVAA